ncbi:hypothetical protein BJ508DRAFT_372248 [Ascobolus immersus RN42]|uniref:Uncharacterized protein n=1 Tax=Ascobolus immersus RN42 TaxID=1160509 RepID=A0A3N4IMP3_ASCIM|nr:hypothetical protein BJ508DRAFT_372248 [Ascobolus immersus RN42]
MGAPTTTTTTTTTTEKSDTNAPPPPQSTTQRIRSTTEDLIHKALIYATPIFPPESQETVKQAYRTRPYLSTFLTVQIILLLLPITILASLLATLSFVLVILGLLTFLFWGGILVLCTVPILLFTLVVGSFVWGWGAAAYSVYVFAGMGKDMVLGGEGGRDRVTVEGMRKAVQEKVGMVKQEVEAEMSSRFGGQAGQRKVKREEGPDEASLPAFEAGKEGAGEVPGVQDHMPGRKERDFSTEEELYEPEEPITLANGGDDVMRSISRSLS